MVYKVDRSQESNRDLELIFDHLVTSHLQFGDPLSDALDHAQHRVELIEADILALGKLPHQGTIDSAQGLHCRHVTKHKAVIYFDVDDPRQLITILAVFFGRQDHQRHMLTRMGLI